MLFYPLLKLCVCFRYCAIFGDFVTNPGIRVGNSYEQWHHSYFLPDGRQTIKDGVSRFCVWLLWGVEFIWKGTPFMFWLTAGTGGGGLVELRGLSLDWLWSLMPLRWLTERRGASQPAPKQVVKSGSWEESAVLACCLSGANHPSVFPTLYFWVVFHLSLADKRLDEWRHYYPLSGLQKAPAAATCLHGNLFSVLLGQ